MTHRHLPTWLRTAALAAGTLLVSCRGCNEAGPSSLLALTSTDTPGAVYVSDLAGTADKLEGFIGHATQKAGAGAVRRLRDGIVKNLGFDPLHKEEYAKVGIDAAGGLLLFLETGGTQPLLAVSVADRSLFDKSLKELIARVDGADHIASAPRHGRPVFTAGRPFGNDVAPSLHWCHVGKIAVVAPAEALPQLDIVLTRLEAPATPGKTLVDNPLFVQGQKHVPEGSIVAFARAKEQSIATAMTTSVTIDASGLQSDTFVGLPLTGLQAGLGVEPTLPLASRVQADAVALLLSRAAQPEGMKALRAYPALSPLLDRGITPLNQAVGIDLEKDILPLLVGPLTVGVHLANVAQIPQMLREGHGPQGLLDAVQIAVTAEVKDPAAMVGLLEQSRQKLAQGGLALRRRTATAGDKAKGGKSATVFEPDIPAPKLGWAVLDHYYVYGAGTGRLQQTLDHLAGPPSTLPADLQASVGGTLAQKPGTVLLVRGAQLANAAGALTGANGAGAGLGALLGTAVELLRTIGDLGVALSAETDGLRLQIREHLS